MSTHLARYLKDFSTPRASAPVFQPQSFAHQESMSAEAEPLALLPAMPVVDLEAERAAALADGRAEAEAELQVKHEAALAALKEAHKAELETLTARYAQDYAAALAERVTALTGEVADQVAAQTGCLMAGPAEHLPVDAAVGLGEGPFDLLVAQGPPIQFEFFE